MGEEWFVKRDVSEDVGNKLLPDLWRALSPIVPIQEMDNLMKSFGLTVQGQCILFDGPYTLDTAVEMAEALK
jgi:hypothetical protein